MAIRGKGSAKESRRQGRGSWFKDEWYEAVHTALQTLVGETGNATLTPEGLQVLKSLFTGCKRINCRNAMHRYIRMLCGEPSDLDLLSIAGQLDLHNSDPLHKPFPAAQTIIRKMATLFARSPSELRKDLSACAAEASRVKELSKLRKKSPKGPSKGNLRTGGIVTYRAGGIGHHRVNAQRKYGKRTF